MKDEFQQTEVIFNFVKKKLYINKIIELNLSILCSEKMVKISINILLKCPVYLLYNDTQFIDFVFKTKSLNQYRTDIING